MKIAVVGLGYVGLSLACLLSKHHDVLAVDIDQTRVDKVNRNVSPIADPDIVPFLAENPGVLHATIDAATAYTHAELVIIATPTNYDDTTHRFDTSSIESVLTGIEHVNPKAMVIIKSTIPVGYTETISQRFPSLQILFSPEFLREGHALHDNLHPSRIVVGVTRLEDQPAARLFSKLLQEGSEEEDTPAIITGSTEAEAIKLFANTYLALRVSFFNELDTYAESKGLDTRQIIDGVCLDPRIGNHYNNPSFGYGGYCLPKDSKQLLANYADVPQNLIRAIVDSNDTRKDYIAQHVLSKQPNVVGAYRLVMKTGSDNFRQNAMLDVVSRLQQAGVEVVVYEPNLDTDNFNGCRVVKSLDAFKNVCDMILANRFSSELTDVKGKVYTRDLWHRD